MVGETLRLVAAKARPAKTAEAAPPCTMEPMPSTPFGEVDEFVSQIVQYLMLDGTGPAVWVLHAASRVELRMSDSDGGYSRTPWGIILGLPGRLYVGLNDAQRTTVGKTITEAAGRVVRAPDDYVSYTTIEVDIAPKPDWRSDAIAWLRGEGVNNQGRVRTDNMPNRQEDGLLFRSEPEIHLYKALKAAGVTFAPLPVYLHGGSNYQRIEPDFVVFQVGRLMLIEVDGDTYHHETPAEADRRTRMFEDEGAFVRHVKATECDSPDKAAGTTRTLLASFERWRGSR
jgi:hypothetical protein